MIVSIIILSAMFLCALAILDFSVMHLMNNGWPDWMYRYWLSLVLVVVVFAFSLSYVAYVMNVKTKFIPAIFSTTILLFWAGLLDFAYYIFTVIKGEPYTYEVWHWAYKLGYTSWGWSDQIVWAIICVSVIVAMWYYVLKKK